MHFYVFIHVCMRIDLFINAHVNIILVVKQCFVGVSETCRLILQKLPLCL